MTFEATPDTSDLDSIGSFGADFIDFLGSRRRRREADAVV
jgi:hypothetical protein